MQDPNSRWFWLAIGAFTFLCVPFPFVGRAVLALTGLTAERALFGLPLWFWITVAAACALVVVTIFGLRRWDLRALDEDRDGSSDG
jgi:hypothetical protein